MAKKVILGTDIARDAFKTKVNDNFTELYDKDASLEGQINNLDANKVDKAQSGWISATLQNGWTGNFQYKKNGLEQISIVADISAGTLTNGTSVASLPLGYRPHQTVIVATYDTGLGRIIADAIYVNTTGDVRIRVPGQEILKSNSNLVINTTFYGA